jgi:hypothetical protein
LPSHRSQQIIAIVSILSLVVLTLTFASMFNPELAAFKRLLGLSVSESNSTINSVNTVFRSPDFHDHSKFLRLNPSSVIDVGSYSSLQLNEFTVAAWFRTNENHTSDSFIVNKGGKGTDRPGENMNYGIWIDELHNINGGFETESGIDYFVKATDAAYNDAEWHYVTLSYDGDLLSLYVNGILKDIKITNNAEPDTATKHPLSIGVNSQVKNGFFIGRVDEVSIWDRQLSNEELISQYESGILSNNGLVFHMSFN